VTAPVIAVILAENGVRTAEIDCPVCGLIHRLNWPAGRSKIGKQVTACGAVVNVSVPSWAHGPLSFAKNQRTVIGA